MAVIPTSGPDAIHCGPLANADERASMNSGTLIVTGRDTETRTFELSTPSIGDLRECSVFLSKEGIAYDDSSTALAFSFLSMPKQHFEAEFKISVQEILHSRRDGRIDYRDRISVPALVPGFWNYYHLLIDCLPRILLSLDVDPRARILVTEFQAARLRRVPGELLLQIADIFSFKENLEVIQGDLLHLERAIVPTLPVRFIGPTLRIFQNVAGQVRTDTHRRVYVSRRLASARRVLNEEQVVETVRSFGFETVCLEELPLLEQIRLFREAEAVIGPHGAGLANIVFSQPGTNLVEFLHDRGLYKVPIFSELSALTKGKHIVLSSKSESNPQHPGHAGNMDMTVDCAGLRSILEGLNLDSS
jgi:Glycosyltransferase 61